MVAAAIRTLGRRDVDVVLVVRGGGARSDLATFDTEVVARAIATCPRPVLTGLGHEVDRSVADEVAHVALKTPTACAGDLIARVRQFRAELSRVWDAIGHAAAGRLAAADRSLAASTRQAARVTRRSVDAEEAGLRRAAQALARQSRLAATTSYALVDHDARRTAAASIRLLAHHSSALNASGQRLARRAPASARQAGRHLDAVDARVRALDPARTLARGWSITRTLDGHAVRSAGELAPGDTMVTSFVDGEVRSRVEEVDGP
jgi:exodeoxyribonuclease VII large subunit